MAGSVNKVILIGNLGADPEVRHTQDGRPIVNLRLATSESWRDKATGERKERTEWHRVVIFSEPLCRVAEQYLKKGSKIYVEGQLQGGVAQGIGWALNEEYIYNKDGKVDNPGFLDYRMPVCSDLPMLDCIMVEVPNPKHPQGVKGGN